MRNILKNRRALSTVVTTLIILVVSVLLAGVVTYFAINVVSTRVQQESLNLQYAHVWYSTDTDGGAEAAVMITNTGGRDVVIQTIQVRGQTVNWTNVFIYTPTVTLTDLYYIDQSIANASTFVMDLTPHSYIAFTNPMIAGGAIAENPVLNPPTLKSGSTIILYMTTIGQTEGGTPLAPTGNTNNAPGSVTVNDVGLTIAISVFTAQATYYKETNVNALSAAS
jgi:hypothetical protein